MNWRELERIRMQYATARRLEWTCNHRHHDPTDGRGSLSKRTLAQLGIKRKQFTLKSA